MFCLPPRIAAICAFVFLCSAVQALDPPEHRAFYAATFDINTQSKCDTIIAKTLASNVNEIFVEVRGRADAYYYPNREDSTYPNTEPRGELYAISPAGFDALQYFIDKLHAANPRVEVHAWCTTFNTWNRSTPPSSASHVYNAHPEWITESATGITYTYSDDAPLDPGIPAVQDYITNVFMDIVRNYDVDGIHFDYVRLLGTDSGFDPVAKARFLAETGWNYDTDNTGNRLGEVYEAWRRDQISRVVQRVHTQTMLEKPWVEVSGFLVNFDDSVEFLAQGYNWWVAHGAIDVLHPGCYSSTVSGTVADWDFYVSKLAQNGDQNKRPLVCAVGDYLLTASLENAQAVTTLRTNSRVPDGFNFFDYGSLFVDGASLNAGDPADKHAQNLFNAGGPMDDDAPVPTITHKIPLGEETTPPSAPASAAVTLVGGTPRITFNRPAAAGDSDLPVHYRIYRDTANPVNLTYANMKMEWWDLASSRSSFTFDDALCPAGTYRYTVVSYDNWNNEAAVTVGPVTVSTSGEYIIETRTGGQHVSDYSESGTFSDSSSHSTAAGCTAAIGSRFALPADGNGRNDKARFTPSAMATGTYNVYVTSFNVSSANALGVTFRKNDGGGVATSTFNLTYTATGNQWFLVGAVNFTAGSGHYVEFDNATQTNLGDSTNARMNAAAVRFVRTNGTPKESKPAVSASASTATQVIVDSTPQALDYDDDGSSGKWATSSLSGYYNGNARFYSSANTFPMNSYAVWLIDLPRSGNWAIDGWVRNNTSFATQAQYRFVDGTGTVRNVTTTQRSAFDSTTTGDWLINVDGVSDASAYYFNKGHNYVTIYGNAAGAQTVVADALRFRLISTGVNDWPLY
ncbi:MAG: family 10 glycosylhydrolase [Candidatus Sumerlaeaceae bacterium]|nr:family 10 glycosylhydrolase [Candidatus Sumerlaeaceae bacterium]